MYSLFKKIFHHASPSPVLTDVNPVFSWGDVLQGGKNPLWVDSLERCKAGQNVLIATSVGGFKAAATLEGLLGVALTLRGCHVRFLLCDQFLPGCMRVHMGLVKSPKVISEDQLKETVCPGCWQSGLASYSPLGIPISKYSDYCSAEEVAEIRKLARDLPIDEIRRYVHDGIHIGEHALAGTLRFFSRGTLEGEPDGEGVLRKYFEAALKTAMAARRCFKQHEIQDAVFHHGIYVPQGIIGEVARQMNVHVVNWQVAYRRQCFIFSHRETYHHALLAEPCDNWRDVPWSQAIEKNTMQYLQSRWHGTQDWIWFHTTPKHDEKAIRDELRLDPKRPVIALLTNVFWDAQLHYRANAFPNMLEWILTTIEYFKERGDLQLVIRIHPAEVNGSIKSRQLLEDEIAKRYPSLPENVCIISPTSQLSTYTLCNMSDTTLIYGTKTGVEITAKGIPVIVAGEAWIRNKGLTDDASSPHEYLQLLDGLPKGKRMSQEQTDLAKKYAFHFFFRRFIPVKSIKPDEKGANYSVGIERLEDILPGMDIGLDTICDGIMRGSEFIHQAEKHIS